MKEKLGARAVRHTRDRSPDRLSVSIDGPVSEVMRQGIVTHCALDGQDASRRQVKIALVQPQTGWYLTSRLFDPLDRFTRPLVQVLEISRARRRGRSRLSSSAQGTIRLRRTVQSGRSGCAS